MPPSDEAAPRIAHDKPTTDKWMALCLAFLVLAGAEFVVRGPVRAIRTATHFNDFLSPYIQASAWTRGLDPYSPETLLALWPEGAPRFLFLPIEVADGSILRKRGIPTAYPIPSLVLIAPLSRLPWGLAYGLWLAIHLALFGLMLSALVALAGFSCRDPLAVLLVAFTLALAPFHTGLVTGNPALIAVEAAVISLWTARQGYDVLTAILLTVSAGLKPQIGFCFLLYYLMRRRWRLLGRTLALLMFLTALGLLRMALAHTPWLANYLKDNQVLLESGILSHFTPANPMRFGLINLQVVLYSLVGSVSVANRLAVSIGATFLVVWLVVILRRNRRDEEELELLDAGAIAVLSLLPIYHRFYDAALLVLPLCWAMVSFRKARTFSSLTLLLLLPFLIPGGTILESLESAGRIPSTFASRWWWQRVVMPHEVWLLVLLSILLLYEMTVDWNRRNASVALSKPVGMDNANSGARERDHSRQSIFPEDTLARSAESQARD